MSAGGGRQLRSRGDRPTTPGMERLAERALDAARHRLLDSGNPAFVAVAVPDDAPPRLASLVVANVPATAPGVGALQEAFPGVDVVVVGCARQGRHLRFTVHDLRDRLLVDRLEVREQPIGELGLV